MSIHEKVKAAQHAPQSNRLVSEQEGKKSIHT